MTENSDILNYPPYGKVLREFVDGEQERYLTTQHERDEETGLDYRGARYYDSDIGRFLSLDPHAVKYPSLSDYCYVAGNPLIFIDSDGKDIVIPNEADRAKVQTWINERAQGYFAIKSDGTLYQAQSFEDTEHSNYYTEKLLNAINSEHSITIEIGTTYIDTEDGVTKDVDINAGGGVTQSSGSGTKNVLTGEMTLVEGNSSIIVSGNSNNNIKDKNGHPLRDDASDILAHELVGHAIPFIIGSDTGNAVENENKVRKELGPYKSVERAAEAGHGELEMR